MDDADAGGSHELTLSGSTLVADVLLLFDAAATKGSSQCCPMGTVLVVAATVRKGAPTGRELNDPKTCTRSHSRARGDCPAALHASPRTLQPVNTVSTTEKAAAFALP